MAAVVAAMLGGAGPGAFLKRAMDPNAPAGDPQSADASQEDKPYADASEQESYKKTLRIQPSADRRPPPIGRRTAAQDRVAVRGDHEPFRCKAESRAIASRTRSRNRRRMQAACCGNLNAQSGRATSAAGIANAASDVLDRDRAFGRRNRRIVGN